MKMKTKWMIIPIALLVMGCAREKEYSISYIDGEFTLYATFGEHETRTQLQQDGSVFWNPGDCINVFYGNLSGKFASSNTEPSDYAEFTGLLGAFTLDGKTEFVAAYPYSEETSLSDGTLSVSLPSEQVAVEGSFADNLFISVAKSKDYDLYFYNVCGGVKFSLAREGIKKVIFKGNDEESLAGRLEIVFSDGKPQVYGIDDGKTSVTLTAPGGNTFKPGAFYYFVLAPQALQKGYTMELYSDVLEGTVSDDSPVTIRRSVWGKLTDLVPRSSSGEVVPEAIDLGLPSGTKWASVNLGASMPEDYGNYYAWGETEPKENYWWTTYKWHDEESGQTKYNSVDSKFDLSDYEYEDDAAYVKLGSKWRIPTLDEFNELISTCEWVWVRHDDISGYKVTGPNGNVIFLPAAGSYGYTDGNPTAGWCGEYWCSSIDNEYTETGYYIHFYEGFYQTGRTQRCYGNSIRPVYDETKTIIITSTPTNIGPCSVEIPFTISTTETFSGIGVVYSTNIDAPVAENYGDGSYIVYGTSDIGSSMFVTDLKPNTTYFARVFITGEKTGMEQYGNTVQFTTEKISFSTEYVDLGLSVKWATCNLGSSTPFMVGAYYAWGETVPAYMRTSYKWAGPDGFTKYNAEDGKVTLEAEDDAAAVNLGGKWRMPTNDEITELRNSCTWVQAIREGVPGSSVTGPNGNSIFIPVSEGMTGSFRANVLSSTLNTYYEGYEYVHALSYSYDENFVRYLSTFRDTGEPIRPVYDDSSELPGIEVTPTDIDFGAVPYGTSSTKYVTVKNIGTGVLTFSVTNVSVPYYVETNADGSPKEYSLSAGESMQLAFTFTPNSATYMGGGRCTIVSNATVSTISVTYSGQGAEPGQISVPEAVDLGLPSGLKWASCNLGASKPEESGNYFAWGETEPKSNYSWDTYKFGNINNLTKYSGEDNELAAEDDAATQALGDLWRMPTRAELEELMDNCDFEWTERESINGLVFTSRSNGKQIFLPASGIRTGTALTNFNVQGAYWTSTLRQTATANYLLIYDEPWLYTNNRCNGYSIRPVYGLRGAAGKPVLDCSPDLVNFGNVTVGSKKSMTVTIKNTGDAILKFFVWSPRAPFSAEGYSYYSSTQETLLPGESKIVIVSYEPTELTEESDWLRITSNVGDGEQKIALIGRGIEGTASTVATPEIVDLGLSVKWASFNLGASRPEDYGNYYAWGETIPKEAYSWETYQWCQGNENALTKYCFEGQYGYNGFTDSKTVLDLEDDAAHVNLGGNWRMPTDAEWRELRENCTLTWTTQNGVPGRLFTANNGNSIFLPAASHRGGTEPLSTAPYGIYWSSSLYSAGLDSTFLGFSMYIHPNGDGPSAYQRYYGFSVRAVYGEPADNPYGNPSDGGDNGPSGGDDGL